MMSIDQGKPVLLVLLNVSAAFGSVNHNVFFSMLKDTFCLRGKVITLFRSYLEKRPQRVTVHGILSDGRFVLSGVAKGAVLGPVVLTIYTCPIGVIAQRYRVK